MVEESLQKILKTEVSEPFIQGMKDRMLVSYYKYGAVSDGIPRLDCIASAITRIRKYAQTGNTEWLMDGANFLMMEFMQPKHPKAHFRNTDSDESPGRTSNTTGLSTQVDNHGKRQRAPLATVERFTNTKC